MPRAFHRWLATLDPNLYDGAVHGTGWMGTALAGALVIAIGGVLSPTRDFFGLDAAAAAACFAPVLLLNAGAHVFFKRVGATWERYGVGLWLTALFMIFFAGSLVSLSAARGAAVMAAILFVVALAYGYILRATPGNLLSLGPILLGLAASLALGLEGEQLLVISLAGPAALGAHLAMGAVGLEAQQRHDQHEAMKAAVQAQVLDERGRDVSRLNDAILRILQNNHDAGNALSAALLYSQLLARALEDGGEPGSGHLKDLSGELSSSLMRLRTLVDQTRALGLGNRERAATIDDVELLPVVESIAAAARRKHANVTVHVTIAAGLRVQVSGGEDVLFRIFENLVENACEGDGHRLARNVWVTAEPSGDEGEVVVAVADDGPGFSPEQLAQPIQAFATQKPLGTGVGLYVVERLVRASRGELTRGARPEGGARVAAALRSRRGAL